MRRERTSVGSARWSSHTDEGFGSDRDLDPDDDGSNSIRILPDGTKVSANIFRRIKSLGLHSELGYVSSHRRSRSDDHFDRLDSTRSAASRSRRHYSNAVTFIGSDSEIELASCGKEQYEADSEDGENHSRKEPSPRPDFANLLGERDGDDISSSEEDEPAQSPKYSVWLTPPKLPGFEYPETVDSSSSQDSGGPSSSNDGPPNVTRLGSETEQQRLDAYLKRVEEEERMKQKKREKPKLPPKSPRFTRETEYVMPLDLGPLDLDKFDHDKDLKFTPVNDNWNDSGFSSDAKSPEPEREEVQPEAPPNTDRNVKRGVELTQSSAASDRISIEDPSRRVQLKPSTSKAKIQRSGSFLKRSKSKLSLSRSYRKVRQSETSNNVASTRAAAVQRDLFSGFKGDESKRTTFVVKGSGQKALDLVAAACQRHLGFAVWKRYNGYKLRVEGTYPGLKLRLSLFFEERIGPGGRSVTMVDVRASRKDRGGNKNHSRMLEFYKALVTQLDIEGHIEYSQ